MGLSWKNDLAKDIKSSLSQREAKAFDEGANSVIMHHGLTRNEMPVNPYKAKEE